MALVGRHFIAGQCWCCFVHGLGLYRGYVVLVTGPFDSLSSDFGPLVEYIARVNVGLSRYGIGLCLTEQRVVRRSQPPAKKSNRYVN